MKPEIKKLLILNLPYLLFVWLFDKVGAAVRLSLNAFDEDKKKALECGMNGFLSKPIVIEELISTLQNNLVD